MQKKDKHFTAVLWILLSVAGRLLPHPPNVTPTTNLALFSGTQLSKFWAFLVSFLALIASDALLSRIEGHAIFSGLTLFTYSGFAAIVAAGFWLRRKQTVLRTAGTIAGSSFGYWIWTNFGVWLLGAEVYPHNLAGLSACYVNALPFLGNSLVGDLAWGFAIFGSFAALRHWAGRRGFVIEGA